MIETVKNRIRTRLAGEDYDGAHIDELTQTVIDRICLRAGVTEETFPAVLHSIAVDATVKAWRRHYYEGITSERAGDTTDNFVSDILAEYGDEIAAYIESAGADSGRGVIRFL